MMKIPALFIVAEIGGNHNGSLKRAYDLIEAAAEAGADAVKFQCFQADTLTLKCDHDDYRIHEGPWAGKTLYDLYSQTETPREWFPSLFERAEDCGLIAFASVFSPEDVDFMESLDCPIYKIASFEITDIPLIEYAASTGKPLIISQGMASEQEIVAASQAAPNSWHLRCVSAYPARGSGALFDMLTKHGGFSDHTLSTVLPAVAIGRGATVIEKHLTLSRDDGGPDDHFSLEPDEFKEMVLNCWEAWEAIQPTEPETPYKALRRSLRACADITEGDAFTNENVRSVRPNGGLAPKYLPNLLGMTSKRNIKYGEPIIAADLGE